MHYCCFELLLIERHHRDQAMRPGRYPIAAAGGGGVETNPTPVPKTSADVGRGSPFHISGGRSVALPTCTAVGSFRHTDYNRRTKFFVHAGILARLHETQAHN